MSASDDYPRDVESYADAMAEIDRLRAEIVDNRQRRIAFNESLLRDLCPFCIRQVGL